MAGLQLAMLAHSEPRRPVAGCTEDTAAAKIAVFKECGIEVAITPSDMADALLRAAKAKGVTLS